MTQNVNSQEFKISEATIFAERLQDEYNITNYIGELSFFEDIERPYVTAQIVCMDDIGLFDEVKIRGSEQIRLTVEAADQSVGDLRFTMIMNIVSIIQTNKVGDRSEIYHLNCISPHAYRDANIKISRAYTGKLENIAMGILKNHLDVDVDISYMGAWTSMQKPVKVLTPYISPLESAEWLMQRATTMIGSPFYIWQTIYDQVEGRDTLRVGSLEFMLNAPAFNPEKPLIYSAARAQKVAALPLAEQAVTVKKLRVENIQDTLKMVHEGAVGARLQTVDTYTGQEFDRHYAITDQLERLSTMRSIPFGAEQNVFDEKQELTYGNNTRTLDQLDARYFNTITSFGTYGSFNSYHDVQDASEALNKLRAPSVRSMFNKNMIDITIPGISFFAQLGNGNSGVSVGDTVYIDFLNSDVDTDDGTVYNEDLSGLFLIHKCRNIFRGTVHEIVASVSKIATRPPKLV
jgi:hypothetical protein